MKPIEDFTSTYTRPASREARRQAVRLFLKMLYPNDEADYEEQAERYLAEKTNRLHDVMRFNAYMVDEGKSTLTRMNYLQGVKGFLVHHGHEISDTQWKRQVLSKLPKSRRAETDEEPLTHEAIAEILSQAPLQLRALVLVLCSSGMRLGEALQIAFKDVDLESVPAAVTIPAAITKTGGKRKTFLSAEAVDALRVWQKHRPTYLAKRAKRHFSAGRDSEDRRIFPFTDETAQTMWGDALARTTLFTTDTIRDPTTNRLRMHLHMCRKFFRTYMPTRGVPVDVVEAMLGHEGYLTAVYRQHNDADLARFYLKGEPAVTITTAPTGATVQVQEVEALRKENARLAGELAQLTRRIDESELNRLDEAWTVEENIELEDQAARLIARKSPAETKRILARLMAELGAT